MSIITSTFKDTVSNILVVDDRPNIIHIIELALEEQPVNVYSANNGFGALASLEARSYDLLLLDVKMPDLSGFEVCRKVRQHEKWGSSKIIMISASNNPDDKLKAFNAGADDYVTKPFHIKELKARIQVMLNLRKAEREAKQRYDQLLELIHVSERLNLQLNSKDTASEIVWSALRLAKADQACLMIWDSQSACHSIAAAAPPQPNELGEGASNPTALIIPQGVGVCGLVEQTGRSQIIPNYKDFAQQIPQLPDPMIYETVGIPVRIKDRYIGCLVIFFNDPNRHIAEIELDTLSILANQSAIALENARLYTDLQRETDKYRLITDKASDLIVSFDTTGKLSYVNERVETILGYTPSEMLGKPLSFFLAPQGQLALTKLMQALLQSKPSTSYSSSQPQELVALSKEKVPVDLEFNFGLLLAQTNTIVGFQAIGRDVTARKRSEENERMRMIGQIASGVAHDLNNVLANILGHAQLLKTETTDKDVIETIEIIEQSAHDGAETVRRIQEFTVQRMQQKLDLLDLNQVVQSAIDLNRPRWRDDAQRKGMQIKIEPEFGLIPLVQGKAAELREVLINLFNNAIDALPSEGGRIGFRTYLETSGQMVCLQVWDSGKGMSAEVRRHIFEPFYSTKGVRGTGLGLSVAYGIISRFGGEIAVDSIEGKGTTFFIRLPIARQNDEQVKTLTATTDQKEVITQHKGRILAIDDEPSLRNVISRALALAGFETDVASGGNEALELLAKVSADPNRDPNQPYDIIFTDLGMPEMTGWELAEAVQQTWPNIPIVLVTGWGENLDAEKLAQYNIKYTIAKPFNIQDLMKMASSIITK